MANVKSEMGIDAVILHTQTTKKGGIFGFHSKEVVEVIAAIEEGDLPATKTTQATRNNTASNLGHNNFTTPKAKPAPKAEIPVNVQLNVPRNVLNQYQTAGTSKSVEQAQAQVDKYAQPATSKVDQEPVFAPMSTPVVNTKEQDTNGLSGRIIKSLPKESAPSGEATASFNIGKEEGENPEEKIQDLETELANMKAMLLQYSKNSNDFSSLATLQNTLLNNEVSENVMQDIISKMAGSEIVAPKDSSKAVKALERYLKKTVRLANGITLYSSKTKVVALIGPTGVGKTTTLAKIASRFVLEHGSSVALITADTYRISAVEQLKTYSDILGLPLEIVYTPEDLKEAIAKHMDKQLILIDTAGRSQYNEYQMKELNELLSIDIPIEKHLVMSATTKNSDGMELSENFAICKPDRVIFTKVDETSTHGIILNILHKRKMALSYITTGQSVPDDIEAASAERLCEMLLR